MFCQAQSPTHTQQAITAYLAEVPLPEGWREEAMSEGYRYFELLDISPEHVERVLVSTYGVKVWPTPAHWPDIPQAVLIRAAVQCHRLREEGR